MKEYALDGYTLTAADRCPINMRQRAHELVFPFKAPEARDLTRSSLTLDFAADEIDRLRAALEEIADPCRHGWASNSMPDFQHIARDQIRSLGGTCDPMDVLEKYDIHLRKARAALARIGGDA